MGSPRTGRVCKLTFSSQWTRENIEIDEAEKRRAARSRVGYDTSGKKTSNRKKLDRSYVGYLDEADD